MFVEKLTENDLTELFAFICKNVYGAKDCISGKQGVNAELISKEYNLQKSEFMVIFERVSKMNQKEKGFEMYVRANKLLDSKPMGEDLFVFRDANFLYEVKDFLFVHSSHIVGSTIWSNADKLNRAYLKFMYNKFGEPYKKAYMDYRVGCILKMAKETQDIADEMSK